MNKINKKTKAKNKLSEEEVAEEFDFTNASSVTECTGLMPTPPETSEEYESYLSIYDFKPHAVKNKKEKKAVK